MSKTYIKCLKCNTVNLNLDYCSNCGAILNIVLKRKLEREKRAEEKLELERLTEKPSTIEAFLRKGSKHSNIIIRLIFKLFYYIWFFFAIVIGGLIAAVISTVAG
ncbi:hypothetical protein FLAN108750_09400 [Flavobacterium antarcticum]|uniref:hypothetical protein n=1 Tax=Flavobacterium antarcticum TaxID=271155 RepID=UPI0003B59E31|nr:hypothetical protein [Flavobacterium antarcticum]